LLANWDWVKAFGDKSFDIKQFIFMIGTAKLHFHKCIIAHSFYGELTKKINQIS